MFSMRTVRLLTEPSFTVFLSFFVRKRRRVKSRGQDKQKIKTATYRVLK